MTNLSENEEVVYSLLPATSDAIANNMGVSHSYVRTLIWQMRRKGVAVEQNQSGRYYVEGDHDPTEPAVNVEARRSTAGEKAAITRAAKKRLAEMERQLVDELDEMEPQVADGGMVRRGGGTDIIFHRTDDHFGQVVTNQYGEETVNSEITESRIRDYFDEGFRIREIREDMGTTFDTAHLLLGGDVVTNESIYDGQAHYIDETLDEQLDRASDVYWDQIQRLSDAFPAVQVVCQAGNHGEIRTQNSSNEANADDILYMMLDKQARAASGLDNVTFIQSSSTYYVNFSIRDWNAHLRHGHDASLEHIGTSAGKQRWQSWLIDHGFDVAFRGHYHALKEEPVNGVPVLMGGTPIPQTDFEESRALSGRAMGAIHGATDEYPVMWTERVPFE